MKYTGIAFLLTILLLSASPTYAISFGIFDSSYGKVKQGGGEQYLFTDVFFKNNVFIVDGTGSRQ